MATLEVHDADGRVSRYRITRDTPATFGSDPLCDVVLNGPGVSPFHGRIRWSKRRYKIDASPGVAPFEVNGKKLVSSSLYQGDEALVGGARIFVLSTADDVSHGDKTVVQTDPTRGRPAPPPPPAPAPVPFHKMEMAPPSIELEGDLIPIADEPASPPSRPVPPPLRPASRRPKDFLRRMKFGESGPLAQDFEDVNTLLAEDIKEFRAEEDPIARAGPKIRNSAGLKERWSRLWERPPGEERVFSSPMVIALIATLAVLILFSFLLRGLIVQGAARRLFADAIARMEDGDDRAAIKAFDRFVAENPGDPRVGKARVLRGMAKVRQHTGSVGTSWGNALKEAIATIGEVGALPEFSDSKMDLAEQLRKIAEGLADRARDLGDPTALADAGSAVTLHDRLAGQAAASLVERSRIPSKLAAARAAIDKKQARAEALAGMDAGLKASRPDDVYAARTRLVRRHPDLSADREISKRMIAANDLIRAAVRLDPAGRTAQVGARPGPLGPPISVVYRLDPGKRPSDRGAIHYALADGFAFGLDADTGAPLWQVSVGVGSPFGPVPISGAAPASLAFDARSNELVRIEGRTGAIAWRQELGGPIHQPPLVLGNQVWQTTPDGRLLQIDLASGALRATLHLGRSIAATPVADESARHLYLVAEDGCLFVVGLDPLSCVAVEFTGHDPGSIACAPALAGRFLVLPVNQGLDEGAWWIYVVDESGTKIRLAQQVVVGGWTWATPEVSGSVIWSASDRNELVAYAIGLYDAKAPFSPIARIPPAADAAGPSFVVPRGDREVWVASGLSGRYELDPERGRLQAAWTLGAAGPALLAPRIYGRTAVLTQQDARAPGASIWGVDAATGSVLWRTVVGAAWPIAPVDSPTGDGVSALGANGKAITLGADRLRAGGFVEQPLPRAGAPELPAEPSAWIEIGGATVIVPSPGADHLLVRADSPEFVRVDLPAPLGATPVAWGPHLLIPGRDGRAYLIDPSTGASAADPFVPPFDRSRPIRWLTPRPLDDDAMLLPDADGLLRRLVRESSPRPRLVATAEVRLDNPPLGDLASTGAAILVAGRDGTIRSLAAHDLTTQGTWPLASSPILGPIAIGGLGLVVDAANTAWAFAPDGRKLWSTRIEGDRVVGSPTIRHGWAWFLTRDGWARPASTADGTPGRPIPLELLPARGPMAAGADLVIPEGVGTFRCLPFPQPGASPP
ncbi:PQQ-binding-like beta-propeller repeat protein [Tundrisphaera sp. TA3]|uniref:outer membrane protein assembly factor BamB family protein n=1 Tax=Tundrisphaera sp. TA3 TaxID=3435775 RepID=UPI003EB82A88